MLPVDYYQAVHIAWPFCGVAVGTVKNKEWFRYVGPRGTAIASEKRGAGDVNLEVALLKGLGVFCPHLAMIAMRVVAIFACPSHSWTLAMSAQ